MKNLILIFAVLIVLVSCHKDNNNNSNSGIQIKGKIPQTVAKGGATKSDNSLMLANARKVFVVNITNGQLMSEFIDITDGSFTATSKLGVATALIFLDSTNKYLGALSNRGLNLLPLSKLTDGENTTIDLADLSLDGTSVIPSHDPLGNEIIISDDEITRLKEVDGFFESLAKNIDANNDNVIDALVDRQLFIKTRFAVKATKWGMNDTKPLLSDIDMTNIDYGIELDGASGFSKPENITLSGPAGNPDGEIAAFFINSSGTAGGFYSGIRTTTGGLFAKGTYAINIDGYNCTLDYSNNEADKNQLFVLPTLHTNSEGKVTSVTLEYRLTDGSTIDPVNIMTDLMLQFGDNAGNQYFHSPWIRNEGADISNCTCVSGVFTYTPDAPVDISNLQNLSVVYNDLLGNTYFINWNK